MSYKTREAKPEWLDKLRDFEKSDNRKALTQLADTLLPYLAGMSLMFLSRSLGWPLWITLLLALPTGGFLVRSFILFHDCCHGSFLPSRKANDALGFLLGIVAFTPFADWRRSHGIHHSTAGNLDKRGLGDVWTMTVDEYRTGPLLKRALYRFYRNPVTLFVFGPFFIFILLNRLPSAGARGRQLRDLVAHDLSLVAVGALLSVIFGIWNYLLVQGSVIFFGGLAGIWMFYVQHQSDPTYWERGKAWSFVDAALVGSSWYKLPRAVQWITGNIGLHHIHHLSPRIPNYRLEDCLEAIPELRVKEPLGFTKSLHSIFLKLWDERARSLVTFKGALQG
ncbi:MAG: fatty acid desaturase [Spirochaetota bacterium]